MKSYIWCELVIYKRSAYSQVQDYVIYSNFSSINNPYIDVMKMKLLDVDITEMIEDQF